VQLTAPFVFAAARDRTEDAISTSARDRRRHVTWCKFAACNAVAATVVPRDTAVNMTAGCGMQRMLPAAEASAELNA